MYCEKCGGEILPDDSFCPMCGTKIGVEVPKGREEGAPGTEPTPPFPPPGPPPPAPGPPGMPPPPTPIPGAEPKRTSGWAVASLILGIGAFTFLPFIGAILAIVFAVLAKNDIRRHKGEKKGSGMATAGLTLGIIGLVLIIVIPAIVVPLGYVYWWPKVTARRNLLKAVDTAEIYYLQNNNSYEGMTAAKLNEIDDTVEIDKAPGNEPDVVYIDKADPNVTSLYCYSRRDDKYVASARDNKWRYNFDITEPEKERWWEKWEEWNPFD